MNSMNIVEIFFCDCHRTLKNDIDSPKHIKVTNYVDILAQKRSYLEFGSVVISYFYERQSIPLYANYYVNL